MAQPLARFRAGSVSCALWEDEIVVDGTTKSVLKASVSRRYKDRDGNWKSSQSFARNEIPLAIHCLQQAFEKIIEMQNEETGDVNGVDNEEMSV